VKYKTIIIFPFLLLSQLSFSQATDHWENFIDAADTFKYIIPMEEIPADWTNPGFDDLTWLSGPGGIGYGDGDDQTIIPEGTQSVFIRKSFYLADASEFISALLYVDYDDAFVAYLNGTEIARANIGTIGIRPAFDEQSIDIAEAVATTGSIPQNYVIGKEKLASLLINGNNTLALQIHNRDQTSSDLSSTTYLIGEFRNSSVGFRPPPVWFIPPPSVTSSLPLVIIDTWGGYIQDEPKIDAWIKVINNGPGQINNINDTATDFEGYIGIEIRGQSSQMFPKSGYGFETRNQLKEDSSVSLLGMPRESDWILSAPYSDKTMMRNPMTYYLGNHMGRWQPRTQWCELYLNGDYRGVYMLVEKIKRDKDRVNIDKINSPGSANDTVSGGYIVKVDKLDGLPSNEYFLTTPVKYPGTHYYNFTYVYPKAEEIKPDQKTYIKNFLTEFESALNGSNFKDPVNGFRKYIDEKSFVDFQIIQELSNNVDGYRYSTFFHKEKDSDGGKLIAGPLWDFDLCYGNVDYSADRLATDKWLYTTYGSWESSCMHWWARLMQDADYVKLVKWRYSVLRAGPFNSDSIMTYLDNNQALLGNAIDRNFERWPILDQYVWPNSYIGYTYDNEMDFLKTWISDRLDWMDTKWMIPLNNGNTESVASNNFLVYPNPFHSTINLSFSPSGIDDMTIEIFNLQGQKTLSQIFKPSANSPTELSLENINLPAGIYLLQVHQSGRLLFNTKIIRIEDD
jgi:hypothetical protein